MFINYILLSISLSIDSLGIGTTYGLKGTKLSTISKVILFFISLFFMTISMNLGNVLQKILPEFIIKFIGVGLFIFVGIWIIYQAIKKNDSKIGSKKRKKEKKIYNFFIKSLGITINIIRDPISCDMDCSKTIDWKEALYLGIAISVDSICAGIGSSMLGFASNTLPLLVATFSLIFILLGIKLGNRIVNVCNIPSKVWNVLSGLLLIILGIIKGIV